jgi:cytochrome b subunit of formate dehydrogenase
MEILKEKVNQVLEVQFIQTTLYWIATVAAVVVGVSQFLWSAYQENNGKQKVLNVVSVVLNFIDSIIEKLKSVVNTQTVGVAK